MTDKESCVGKAGRREWIALAVLVLPTILLALDMTVLHLAVPHLSADLKPTSSQLLWILDIYGFMIGGFLITMGTLGDRIGRRKLLMIGAALFGIASVMAAFSSTANMLIVTRALLGIAGATLMPSTLSLIRNMFHDPGERTRAIAVWMTGFMVGSAIGPLVGGAMLEFFWWGSVFLLGVPVMLVLLISGPLLLPEFRDEKAGRLDLLSALLAVTMILAVIYGLKDIARNGLNLTAFLVAISGVMIGMLFVRRQRQLLDPMFDINLFRNRTFTVSVLSLLLVVLSFSGIWLMIFQYLQGVIGMSPLHAGLLILPSAIVQIVGAMLVPTLAQRIRPAALISSGLLITAAGMVLMTQAGGDHAAALVVIGTIAMGAGAMPMMILGTDMVVSSAPPEKAGAASATSETAAEMGMALGIAVIGSIGGFVYRQQMLLTLPTDLSAADRESAADTLGGALAVAEQLGEAGQGISAQAGVAFTQALHVNAGISVAIVLVAMLVVWHFLRHLKVAAH
ncbi:MAG: MFS transporter [Alcanivoracaceae bacterium]|nr:MFS transporter [Alcanivoracaceae bacterium]